MIDFKGYAIQIYSKSAGEWPYFFVVYDEEDKATFKPDGIVITLDEFMFLAEVKRNFPDSKIEELKRR